MLKDLFFTYSKYLSNMAAHSPEMQAAAHGLSWVKWIHQSTISGSETSVPHNMNDDVGC